MLLKYGAVAATKKNGLIIQIICHQISGIQNVALLLQINF